MRRWSTAGWSNSFGTSSSSAEAMSASTPASVAQALLAADVVDELRLVIGPMIVGRGRRLLDSLPSMQLELIRSEISPTGYLLVDYRVIR